MISIFVRSAAQHLRGVALAGTLALGTFFVAGCSGDPVGIVDGDFAYRIEMTVAESFPVQIGLEVEVENVGAAPATVSFRDGCVVLMRVYDGDDLVWDLGNGVVCPDVIVEVTLRPGERESFDVGLISAAEILGDRLPDGEYRVVGYLRPEGGEIELDAGTLELAIPR